MQTIRLLKPHQHAGQTWPAGTQISMRKRQADWLIEQGVAQAVESKHSSKPVAALLSPPASNPPETARASKPFRPCCGWNGSR
jgi:hypothetical protein